jgi:hypothetical protein
VQSYRRSERSLREPSWVAHGTIGDRTWRVGLGEPEPARVFVVLDMDGGDDPSTTTGGRLLDSEDDRRGAIVCPEGLIVGVAAPDCSRVWIETAGGHMVEGQLIDTQQRTRSNVFVAVFDSEDHPMARVEQAADAAVRRHPYPAVPLHPETGT